MNEIRIVIVGLVNTFPQGTAPADLSLYVKSWSLRSDDSSTPVQEPCLQDHRGCKAYAGVGLLRCGLSSFGSDDKAQRL